MELPCLYQPQEDLNYVALRKENVFTQKAEEPGHRLGRLSREERPPAKSEEVGFRWRVKKLAVNTRGLSSCENGGQQCLSA